LSTLRNLHEQKQKGQRTSVSLILYHFHKVYEQLVIEDVLESISEDCPTLFKICK